MRDLARVLPFLAIATLILVSGCGSESKQSSQAQTSQQSAQQDQKPIPVDVAIAKLENLKGEAEYIGSTAPMREISVRSRIEGTLIKLNVDLGDRVSQAQVIGKQDDLVLVANVLQAEAELAALQSQVSKTKTEVSNAKTQVESARLELQQAQADARRLKQLSSDGAIGLQAAEQAQTKANTANQSLKSAQQQVRSQQNEVFSAQKRVDAQTAVIRQAQARLAYTTIAAPSSGIVLQKVSEVGNLLQPGNEILKLGDFSQVKVVVEVSELERSQISLSQKAEVKLDAFPAKSLTGIVSRISPVAAPTSRLIPIEVTIANPKQQIGSGLLARVSFIKSDDQVILAPETAFSVGGRDKKAQNLIFVLNPASSAQSSAKATNNAPRRSRNRRPDQSENKGSGQKSEQAIAVETRTVKIGAKADGKVSILSGLEAGDQFITRSSKPLKDGDKVVLSAISERPFSPQKK